MELTQAYLKECFDYDPARTLHLGYFATEKDAALAYARAAVDHFGKYAPIETKDLFNEAYP